MNNFKCTKWQLFGALAEGSRLLLAMGNISLVLVSVRAVELEDGSHHSWNVRGINRHGKTVTAHVITCD